MAAPASADTPKRVGGHVGFVVPLVVRSNGETTTVADDFVFGLPAGFAVAHFGRFVLDIEAVTSVQNKPSDIGLELHPGIVMGIKPGLAAGLRAALDVEGHSWGFTPLLNHTLYVAKSHTLFAELVVPVRFADSVNGRQTSVAVGLHVGVGF
jgi:hypothetical protein